MLAAIDRFFPLVWLALYAMLPVSGEASDALAGGFDQRQYLDALRSVLSEGRADGIDQNVIGPAYIALAALIHIVSGLSPEDALIALTRGSYALSVAAGMVLVRVLVKRLASAPPTTTLVAQLVFIALAFVARTWNWSDFPWTHFFAAFLCLLFYALRLPRRFPLASAAAAGISLALLALTRSFEFVGVVGAWAFVLAAFWLLRVRAERLFRTVHVAMGAGAFAATAIAVYLATGKRDLFFLYRSSLAGQAGDFLPEEVGNPPTFSFDLIPVKLVQLGIDPCFYSLCSNDDYSSEASPWRMPLAIQLPTLALLPLCVLAVASLLGWSIRHRTTVRNHVGELKLLVEMTVTASGLVLGYTASTITSSSHLKYGFPRVFVLPSLLAAVIAVSLAFVALRLAFTRTGRLTGASRRLRLSPDGAFVFVALLGIVVVVAGATALRIQGLPRLESRHLGSVEYTADCRRNVCGVQIEAKGVAGEAIAIPESSTLTFGCGDSRPRFTIYRREPTDGVTIRPGCHLPRLVFAWPTVMGLPPSPLELHAVGVANADPG